MFSRLDGKVSPIFEKATKRSPKEARDRPAVAGISEEYVRDFKGREVWSGGVRRDGELTAGARLTAWALAAHFNVTTGQLNPSMRRLAEATDQSEQAIVKQTKALVGRGWLVKQATRGRVSNNYLLRFRPTLNPRIELVGTTLNRGSGFNPQQVGRGGQETLSATEANPEPNQAQPSTAKHPNIENRFNTAEQGDIVDMSAGSPGSQGEIRDALLQAIGQDEFDTWLQPATIHWANPIEIIFRTNGHAQHVEKNYGLVFDRVFGIGRWKARAI